MRILTQLRTFYLQNSQFPLLLKAVVVNGFCLSFRNTVMDPKLARLICFTKVYAVILLLEVLI